MRVADEITQGGHRPMLILPTFSRDSALIGDNIRVYFYHHYYTLGLQSGIHINRRLAESRSR